MRKASDALITAKTDPNDHFYYDDIYKKASNSTKLKREGRLDIVTDDKGHELAICNVAAMWRYSQLKGGKSDSLGDKFYADSASVIMAMNHFNNGLDEVVDEVKGINDRCNFRFVVEFYDTFSSSIRSMRKMTEILNQERKPCAVLGAYRSAVSSPLSILTGVYDIPQVSHISSSPDLDNTNEHPLFSRLVPSDEGNCKLLVKRYKELNATHIGVIFVNDFYGSAYQREFQRVAEEEKMIVRSFSFDYDVTHTELENAVANLAKTDFKYFFGIFFGPEHYDLVMTEAYEKGIAGNRDNPTFWVFAGGVQRHIQNVKYKKDSPLAKATNGIGCIQADAGMTGMHGYDKFLKAWRNLTKDDISYFNNKQPADDNQNRYHREDDDGQADFFKITDPNREAVFAYDAVIALGLSACKVLNDGGTLNGQQHVEILSKTTFNGASGPVRFNSISSRVPESALYVVYNAVANEPDKNGMVSFIINAALKYIPSNTSSTPKWEIEEDTPFVYNDGTANPPPNLPPLEENFNFIGKSFRFFGIAIASFVMLSSIGFCFWTYTHRKSEVVKASQPFFLYLICAGVFLMGFSILPLGVDDEIVSHGICSIACMTTFWFYLTGFCLVFGALSSKILRINKVVSASQKFRKVEVTITDVMVPFSIMMTANGAVLIIWNTLAPLQWIRYRADALDSFGRKFISYGTCFKGANANYVPFLILVFVIKFTALALLNIQAYKARKLSSQFSESKYIAIAMVCMFQAWAVGLPVIFILRKDPKILFLVQTFLVAGVCFAIFGSIMLPKVLRLRKIKSESSNRDSQICRRSSGLCPDYGNHGKPFIQMESGLEVGTEKKLQEENDLLANLKRVMKHEYEGEVLKGEIEKLLPTEWMVYSGEESSDEDAYSELVYDLLSKCIRNIMDATITYKSDATSDGVSNSILSLVPASSNHSDAKRIIKMASRILTHLLHVFNTTRNQKNLKECKEMILQSMHNLTLAFVQSICYYSPLPAQNELSTVTTINGKMGFFRPVTALLLPHLYPAIIPTNDTAGKIPTNTTSTNTSTQQDKRILELWSFVVQLISNITTADVTDTSTNGGHTMTNSLGRLSRCRNWENVAPSVATGILCAIVPNLVSYPLPIPPEMTTSPCCRLVHQPLLWNFLQTSLGRLNGSAAGMKGGSSFGINTRGVGSGASGNGNDNRGDDDYDNDDNVGIVDQIVRRRSIHIMRLLIEHEGRQIQQLQKQEQNQQLHQQQKDLIIIWKKYILCFEALEMEVEVHLVDQVWETVTELCAACCSPPLSSSSISLPPMSWEWISSLFARVLLSDTPTLRKLGLFRFLSGSAGISLSSGDAVIESMEAKISSNGDNSSDNSKNNTGVHMNKPTKKSKVKKKTKKSKTKASAEPAPLSIVSPSFVLLVLFPSYDSLGTGVGTGIKYEDEGKIKSADVSELLGPFVTKYIQALRRYPDKLEEFFAGFLGTKCVCRFRTRTLVLLFGAAVQAWSDHSYEAMDVAITDNTVCTAVQSIQSLLSSGGVIHKYRESLLNDFASILSHTSRLSADGSKPDILSVLKTLMLFSSPLVPPPDAFDESAPSPFKSLQTWLCRFGSSWADEAGSACASAFVSGQLLPFSDVSAETSEMVEVANMFERNIGASIVKLCALAGLSKQSSASGMLWPAINNGLSNASIFSKSESLGFNVPSQIIRKITRASILLENGCKEFVLNGMGNGDLVVDKKNGTIMAPPPNIERLLSFAVNFLLHQISSTSICNMEGATNRSGENAGMGSGARSGLNTDISNYFTFLTGQLLTLKNAYPSSVTMTASANDLLKKALGKLVIIDKTINKEISEDTENNTTSSKIEMVKQMALIFAALTCGTDHVDPIFLNHTESKGEIGQHETLIRHCSMVLRMQFVVPKSGESQDSQRRLKVIRSIFQFAKWGALSHLVPLAANASNDEIMSRKFCDEVLEVALDSIHATPANALLPLFETSIKSAKLILDTKLFQSENRRSPTSYGPKMMKIITTLFTVMNETSHNPTRGYMLNTICSIIFRPRLLLEEYHYLQRIKERDGEYEVFSDAPILNAFRTLIEMGGTKKPYISKAVLGYISVAWLGLKAGVDEKEVGFSAIPYREDIAKLLIHKEAKIEESSLHQEDLVTKCDNKESSSAVLPSGTSDLSIARGFILVFLSKLPSSEEGLSSVVLTKLCHYIILWLLDTICSEERKPGATLRAGSIEYCQKIRAWQALCLLSRFVTVEIANSVCEKTFGTMSQSMHGQIRYFVEIFTIQCARRHPDVFGAALVEQFRGRDHSLQNISSLMIISGNLIVGRYSEDFFQSFKKQKNSIPDITSGVLPWLSSTQGFSRAIAQLLAHKLIPLVLSADNESSSDMFLHSMCYFLEENRDMKRLRKKQSIFFETYDADSACTPEGILQIPIDEGGEANPTNLVEVIKNCLEDVYREAHENDTPTWKQVEELLDSEDAIAKDLTDSIGDNDDSLVNFQRKILPLDSLKMTIEDSKQLDARNAAGRNRQELIVCATLIDKVPNLAGLARSAEIFAAQKLVIPDIGVCKMDNFKSISVGAGEWISIEECKENNLLQWLNEQKENGFTIVGVEQTSSSKCLSTIDFPVKTVLLLGKEKEGIPVEYLQAIDICVEIPQLGIIRSLNVHVSGAISIWEYTKQMMASP